MDLSTKQPEHAGLQHITPDDGPEVVSQLQWQRSVERSPSQSRPQTLLSSASPTTQDETSKAYYYQSPGSGVVEYYGSSNSSDEKYTAPVEADDGKGGKRICGLKRIAFIWTVVAVIVIIIIAAVLGGVLGTVLNDSDSSKSKSPRPTNTPGSTPSNSSQPTNLPPSLYSGTGLAVNRPEGESSLYSYYQDPDGRIVENEFVNGAWSIQGDNVPNTAVVATDAVGGTPLAAISWSLGSNLNRQVFYLDINGQLLTTNTTGTNPWPRGYNVLIGDTAAPNSVALAACVDTKVRNGLNGIRTYYASSLGMIREVGMDFSDSAQRPEWNMWMIFNGTDSTTGVDCALSDSVSHVYLKTRRTRALQQWTWSYVDNIDWYPRATGPSDLAGGSPIAATTDELGTDYIFYQSTDNKLIRTQYSGDEISDPLNLGGITTPSKFAATYSTSSDAAEVYYQSADEPDLVSFQSIDRNGGIVSSGRIG